MDTNSRSWAHLVLLVNANSRCQAHLALPMKVRSYQQLYLAQPISTSHQRQHRGALSPIRKGVHVAGAGKIEILPWILPQASAGKLTTK
jgi:hypothetical protein